MDESGSSGGALMKKVSCSVYFNCGGSGVKQMLLWTTLFAISFANVLIDANLIATNGQGVTPAIKVKDVVESPNCLSEARFFPLVAQIVAQSNCRSRAEVISVMSNATKIDVSSAPYPHLLKGAFSSLQSLVNSPLAPSSPLRVTRALTPFVAQYLVFRRGFLRICGVAFESPYVGGTVWERGMTIDVENADVWAPVFAQSPFWTRVGVSFTYSGPDSLDVGRRMIETFQLMWNGAVPDSPVAVSGVFDAATQLATEQAFASGLIFGGLCITNASPVPILEQQNELLLVIIVPSAVVAALTLILVATMSSLYANETPFDGGGGHSGPLRIDVPEDLHNSVEDTSVLSEYARSEHEVSAREDNTRDDELTSGIWEDE